MSYNPSGAVLLQETLIDETFAPGEVFTTEWVDVRQYTQLWVRVETSSFGFGEIEFTNEEGTPTANTLAEYIRYISAPVADPALVEGAINVSVYVAPYGNWYRARWTQGILPGGLRASVYGITGPSRIPCSQAAFPFEVDDHVVLTKSIQSKEGPTGNFVNVKQSGVVPGLSTDTPLGANEIFRTPWVNVEGFTDLVYNIRVNQESAPLGFKVFASRQFFEAKAIENITQSNPAIVTITGHGFPDSSEVLLDDIVGMVELNDTYQTINVIDANTFELNGVDSTGFTAYSSGGTVEQLDIVNTQVAQLGPFPFPGIDVSGTFSFKVSDVYVRVEYQNGANAHDVLKLHGNLFSESRTGDVRQFSAPLIFGGDQAMLTKSVLYAYQKPGFPVQNISPLTQDDATGGLLNHITGHDVRTPVKPPKAIDVGQVLVNPTAATQINLDPTTEIVGVKNMDANENIFVGFDSDVTSSSGWLISPLLGDSFPVRPEDGDEIWVVSGAAVASTDTSDRSPATITNNGGTNPNNALLEDNVFATLDDQGDSFDASGFTANGVFTDISNVSLGVKGRRSSTVTSVITHQETVTGISTGAAGVSTTEPVVSSDDRTYIAAIEIDRNSSETVQSISGLGLTWNLVNSATGTGGDTYIEVWIASGTPTGDSTVTASFSSASAFAVIAVSSYTGVDKTTPVERSSTAIAGGPSTAVTGNIQGDDVNDRVFGFIGTDSPSGSPGAGFTERADLGNATSHLIVQDKLITAAGSQTVNSTLSNNSRWSMVMLVLNRDPVGTSPTITLSHSLGATTWVQELDNTNTRYELDVTGDRAWTATDIGNVVVTVSGTTIVDVDAEIDYIYLKVTEIDEGGLVRVSFIEFGDSLT